MTTAIPPIKRALISVSDKTGITEFAKQLYNMGIEIISTGGTSHVLREAGILHREVDEITGLPEMLDGRVKTLHPAVHGGILGKRDTHAEEAITHQIGWIDLVVVNFYPFSTAVKNKELTWDEAVEYIDIGGPTMVRAAAKNFAWVGVVVDPADYTEVLQELKQQQGLSLATRQALAEKVFALTAQYDGMIAQYFIDKNMAEAECPKQLHLHLEKTTDLRYGENPHQKASAYQHMKAKTGVLAATQHQGKPLSYNNILDAEAAWSCVEEFDAPTCVIVKHVNPCGVASSDTIEAAYAAAYAADSLSAFGGVVALNRPCTLALAEAMVSVFAEVILAPDFSADALTVLALKPNLRVLTMPVHPKQTWEMKFITGGVLLQEKDRHVVQVKDLQIVTQKAPSDNDIAAMLFAWRVLKHIKSNGVLIAKQQQTVGIGAGQVSRVDAVDIAIRKAGNHIIDTVVASDAFFPFRDSIDKLANTGVRAIIQPGGSVRDDEVIAACNEHDIAMVLTGKRCFKH